MARKSRKTNAILEQKTNAKVYSTAIYIRLSMEDIRKKVSDSIGTQKALLLQYLQTQPDIKLYGIYEDDADIIRPTRRKMCIASLLLISITSALAYIRIPLQSVAITAVPDALVSNGGNE